jgi:hypothetical protein
MSTIIINSKGGNGVINIVSAIKRSSWVVNWAFQELQAQLFRLLEWFLFFLPDRRFWFFKGTVIMRFTIAIKDDWEGLIIWY